MDFHAHLSRNAIDGIRIGCLVCSLSLEIKIGIILSLPIRSCLFIIPGVPPPFPTFLITSMEAYSSFASGCQLLSSLRSTSIPLQGDTANPTNITLVHYSLAKPHTTSNQTCDSNRVFPPLLDVGDAQSEPEDKNFASI